MKKNIKSHLRRALKKYDQFAHMEREIATRLLSTLSFMKINPGQILDLGARTGFTTRFLRQTYPKASVIACDVSVELLMQTPRKMFQKHKSLICADIELLPFKTKHFDLIFSNLALATVSDFPQVLRAFYQLLRPHGLLVFTTFGPDTLKELRSVSQAHKRAHDFVDMHDLGDALLAQKFVDPVVNMEYLTLHYKEVEALFAELKATGVTNARADQARGLQGVGQWQEMIQSYQNKFQLASGKIPATVEIIYGHAWVPQVPDLKHVNESGEVVVPISTLKSR